jgi:O-antigen/teichoic acid export membrane protein
MFSELKKLLRHSTVYGLGMVLTKAVSFFMVPLYTHYLTTEDYGVLELLDLAVTICGLFIGMGIGASILRFFYHYREERDKKEVVSSAFFTIASIGLVFLFLAIFLQTDFSNLVFKSPRFSRYIAWMCVSYFFSLLASVPESYIMARQKSGLFTTVTICTLAVNLTGNIIAVAVLKMGVYGIVLVSALVRCLNTTSLCVWMFSDIPARISWTKIRQMLSYGVPLLPANLGQFFISFSDRFFLARMVTLQAVGIYSFGFKFGYLISLLMVQPFGRIWQAQIFEIAEKPDAKRVFARFFTYFSFAILFAALALTVFAREIVHLLSPEEYWAAAPVIPIIAIASYFNGAYQFLQGGLLVQKKTKYVGYAVAICALLNCLANAAAIRLFGYMGAAFSSMFTSFCMAFLVNHFSRKWYRVPYEVGRLLKLAALAFPLAWAGYQFNFGIWAISVPAKIALVFLFPLLLYPIGFYHFDELQKIASLTQMARRTLRLDRNLSA